MSERRSRSGGRAARKAERSKVQFEAIPYIQRKVPVYEMAPDETLELIENNAELILEEIGIEFRGRSRSTRNLETIWCESGWRARSIRARHAARNYSIQCSIVFHPIC